MKEIILIVICLLALTLSAQQGQPLSLDQAIDMALSNSDQLKIQRRTVDLTAAKEDKRLTGQLPIFDVVAGASYTNNILSEVSLRTFQPAPPEITIDEGQVESVNANIGVEGSYMLYDGGQGKSRMALLAGLTEVERARQKVIANGIISAVSGFYHEILKLQQQITILESAMEVTGLRIAKLRDQQTFGKATELDILQATASLNKDQSGLAELQTVRRNLLIDLNRFLGADFTADYELEAVTTTDLPPSSSELRTTIANSPEVQLAQAGIRVADLQIAQRRTALAPTVAAFGNVGTFYQYNDVQQLRELQTAGFTLGLSARYSLNDGRGNRKQIQLAQLEGEVAVLKMDQVVADLVKNGEQLLAKYYLTQDQLKLEAENLTTYEQNMLKLRDLFANGKVNEVTIRDAELAVIQSRNTIATLEVLESQILTDLAILMGKVAPQ